MTVSRLGHLVYVDENMNRTGYLSILKTNLVLLKNEFKRWIILDNDPKYSAI